MSKSYFFIALFLLLLISPLLNASNTTAQKSLKEIYKSGKVMLKLELKIDFDSFPEDAPVRDLRDVVQLNENAYILDGRMSKIHVFSEEGKHLKCFGQRGQGPGDLLGALCMDISRNKLLVWEIRNTRISLFSKDGSFLNSVPLRKKAIISYRFKTLDNGMIILDRNGAEKIGKKWVQTVFLDLYSADLKFIKTIYKKEVMRQIWVPKSRSRIPAPYQPNTSWDIQKGSRLVIGESGPYNIIIINVNKGDTRTITHKYIKEKVTEADKEFYFENCISMNREGKATRGARPFIREKTVFPEYKPAFESIMVDCEGNILALKEKKRKDSRNYSDWFYDAFDADGLYIGSGRFFFEGNVGSHFLFRRSVAGNFFWVITQDVDFETAIIKYKAE